MRARVSGRRNEDHARLNGLLDDALQDRVRRACEAHVHHAHATRAEFVEPPHDLEYVGGVTRAVAVECLDGDEFGVRKKSRRPALLVADEQGRDRRTVDG